MATSAAKVLRLLVTVLLLCAGCDGGGDRPPAPTPSPQPSQRSPATQKATASPDVPDTAATRPADRNVRVVFLGDSITAGYGLEAHQAFPALVGQSPREEGLPVNAVNAGVSGDTTAGGLRRLDWLLRQSPDVLVVGLGGNDGLRAIDPKS